MPAHQGRPARSRLRPAISFTADGVRRQIGRIDNAEVRKARRLARRARTAPPDVLYLGDSAVSFVASYDADKRPLHRMVGDALPPEVTMHAVYGGSYNPLIYNEFVRLLEGHEARPLVILPLWVRGRTLPWIEHPVFGHQRASQFLSTLDATTPLRKIRKGFARPTQAEFERFRALEFPTWAGDLRIGDYIDRLKGNTLDGDEAARLLYAYHHGGEIDTGGPLDTVRELGARLRRLDLPVVVYQTPVPVEKGVELHGPSFFELAERNFRLLEEAFVSGYGAVPILPTGLSVPTTDFIDWRDGSEHLNDRGRSVIAAAVVAAAKDRGVHLPSRKGRESERDRRRRARAH